MGSISREKMQSNTIKSIAIVDDDAAVCSALKFSFEIEGFSVHTFLNAAELLGTPHLDQFVCFVVDQILPNMTGLMLVEELRNRNITAPVVLVTSHPGLLLRARAARAGVAIVEKPLLGNSLMEKVRAVLPAA